MKMRVMAALAGTLLLTGCSGMQTERMETQHKAACHLDSIQARSAAYFVTIDRFAEDAKASSYVGLLKQGQMITLEFPDASSQLDDVNVLRVGISGELEAQISEQPTALFSYAFKPAKALRNTEHGHLQWQHAYLSETGPVIDFDTVMLDSEGKPVANTFTFTVCPVLPEESQDS